MLAINWNWPFSLHNCRVSCSLDYLELKLGSKSRLYIPELYMVLTVKITMSPMICDFSWNHTKSTKNWNLISSAVMTLSSYHYQYQNWVNTKSKRVSGDYKIEIMRINYAQWMREIEQKSYISLQTKTNLLFEKLLVTYHIYYIQAER